MATYKHLRSSTANKRPTTSIADGQLAINTNTASPGLFFKDSAGTGIVKVGPVHVGTTAPNSSPAGSSGNYTGEQWLDTSVSPAQMKVWNGSAWVGIVADELPVSKLQDGAARQLIQTDAAGTGVEWTSNVDVPGTLDVTSTATFDSIAQHPLGTAGAPTITFIGDTNTGIYSPGADQVAISTNGTGRLFITSSGNVGIGQSFLGFSNPLEIRKSGAGRAAAFCTSDTSSSNTAINIGSYDGSTSGANIRTYHNHGSTGDTSLAFEVNGTTEAMRITSAGRLGLGTSSPSEPFDVVSSSSSARAIRVRGRSADNIGLIDFYSNDNTTRYASIGAGAANTFIIETANNERLRVDSSGRVGIGTTSPQVNLHLKDATNPRLRFEQDNSSVQHQIEASSGSFVFTSDVTNAANGGFIFKDATDERFRIDGAGRFLIGTSTARSNFFNSTGIAPRLQVEGNSAETAAVSIVRTSNESQAPSLIFGKTRDTSYAVVSDGDDLGRILFMGADGSELVEAASIITEVDGTPGANDMPGRLVFSTTADGASSPTERMRISSDGSIGYGSFSLTGATQGRKYSDSGRLCRSSVNSTATAPHHEFYNPNGNVGSIQTDGSSTSYNTSSDYRLKENVAPLTGAIDRVNQLQVHRFNFIADPDKTVDGFIAHEAQAVVPECVTGEKDAVDDEGNPVYQGIDQSKLVPLLTAALQEALAEIESLKARLDAANL